METILRSPQRVPNEILHAIFALCSPSTLALLCQVSLTCLQISSPLLYANVALFSVRQESQFFKATDPNPPSAPHLLPYTSRSQTKTLVVHHPRPLIRKAPSASEFLAMPTYSPPVLPPSGPLLLDSYSNPYGQTSCEHLLNPTTLILSSYPNQPTILMAVKPQSLGDVGHPRWTRLREVVLEGFVPSDDLPREWAREGGKHLRVTIDLRRIEGKVKPRILNGSCQELVESWTTQLSGGQRGRIWVGTEAIKEDFGVAIEEVKERCEKGSLVWEELGKLVVEVRERPLPNPIPPPLIPPAPSASSLTSTPLLLKRRVCGLGRRTSLLPAGHPASSLSTPR
ncbi:hypothetical protein BDY24DRAFT_16630 [Mrakia frigida]|uniref:uncharacterized protein n=1 Tax=Mrakia frigida TaxID=29902 RepID=UPI003FCBF7FB